MASSKSTTHKSTAVPDKPAYGVNAPRILNLILMVLGGILIAAAVFKIIEPATAGELSFVPLLAIPEIRGVISLLEILSGAWIIYRVSSSITMAFGLGLLATFLSINAGMLLMGGEKCPCLGNGCVPILWTTIASNGLVNAPGFYSIFISVMRD